MHTETSNDETSQELEDDANDIADPNTTHAPSQASQPTNTSLADAVDNPVIEKIRG